MSTIGDSPPPPPSDAHPKKKIACINTYDHDSRQSEWYVFDDADHNQPPPSPPYPNFIHYLTPFHDDDDHTEPCTRSHDQAHSHRRNKPDLPLGHYAGPTLYGYTTSLTISISSKWTE
ncbi:hypothetical protein RHMOL_Rhmol05G0123300 [Rhododendron molle]|uniref:Uncharacterized protein n=1 Tax=Rhododendron molle TaxID=49168 RepID=A0ACC0NPG0_RHOML|nr:hypothetical protein RHMOL_Rhmol05G0123300 [Rhododendron molle]